MIGGVYFFVILDCLLHPPIPEGGTPGDIGRGIQIISMLLLAYLTGAVLLLLSFMRRESHPQVRLYCLVAYILPCVALPIVSALTSR